MIAIPNMSKPKNCFQCSFNDGIYCALIDNDTDAFISEDPTKVSTKRLDTCPLIEIDLIRCEECKQLDHTKWCDLFLHYMNEDDFCSYGERIDENDRQEEWLDFREEQEFNDRWGKE